MPIFLDQQSIYRLLQRELPPDDVYPDGAPSAFFSTADQFSVAGRVADAYVNLQNIYKNYYPVSAEETLADFEFLYFGYTLDATLTIAERRQKLLDKIRTRRRTTPDDLIATVHTLIPTSVLVEIVEWGNGGAGWMLDVSELEISTILNEFNQLDRTGPDLCQLGAEDYGLTPEEFARMQNEAYTYEVRIYGYTLSADERAQLETILSAAEPARSQHIIVDGLNPADSIGGNG